MSYLLGIDIGSGACKVSLINTISGKIKTLSLEYPTYYNEPGWAEQEPEDWILSASRLIKNILELQNCRPEEIIAVGVSGVTHSLVLLDKQKEILGRSIHLTDSRSRDQVRRLRDSAERLIEKLSLNKIDVMWTISMLDWIREMEPDRWKKISKIFFPKDYLRYRLTGLVLTDNVDAQGTLLFNPIKNKWEPELLELISLGMNTMPTICQPTEIGGRITKDGAAWSGLLVGTPVIVGSTDTLCEVFASSSKEIGDTTVKLATFGRVCVLTEKPVIGKSIINYTYIIPGLWYSGTGTRSCGTSLKWFRNGLYMKLKTTDNAYKEMENETVNIPIGSSGIIFHPYLQGEGSPYDDPYLRGSFIGLSLHHSRGHMIKAVLEGVAFSIMDSIISIKTNGMVLKPAIKFIGGGSKSKIWTKILADVLGMDAVVPEHSDSSVGAALLSGVGVSFFHSFNDALSFNKSLLEEIKYTNESHDKYMIYFDVYKNVQNILSNIYHNKPYK